MIAPWFDVRETPEKGKGLFAKRFIPAGTLVCFECSGYRVLDLDYGALSVKEKEDLLNYAYRRKDGSLVAPSDDSRYLNHSCDANIIAADIGSDIVVRDIQPGEEATYDYRDFYDEGVRMTCRCGAANCCGTVTFEHPVPEPLRRIWKERVDAALKKVNEVEQPLKEELKEKSIFLPLTLPKD